MSVRSAVVRHPAPLATDTMLSARARPSSAVVINAPLPNVTSCTRPTRPAASFFDKMDEVMSGMLSTVAVTSRMAYRRRSAGARSAVAPMIAQPTSRTTRRKVALSGALV